MTHTTAMQTEATNKATREHADKHWYVLYTKSRSEKKVAQRLADAGFVFFCPLKEEWHQWSDRKKKVMEPFFRSYVFARFNFNKDRVALLKTPGVVRLLYLAGKPAIIQDTEMETVIAFFEHYDHNEILKEALAVGKEVAIRNGVLAGLSGIVVWQNKHRVMLDIPGLNMRFSVDKEKLMI